MGDQIVGPLHLHPMPRVINNGPIGAFCRLAEGLEGLEHRVPAKVVALLNGFKSEAL